MTRTNNYFTWEDAEDAAEKKDDALRDILDIAVGWTSPGAKQNWSLVIKIAEKALSL